MTGRRKQRLRHAGLVAEVGAYGCWLLVDLLFLGMGTARIALLPALVVPVLVLLRRRPGVDLVTIATGTIITSVAVTAVVVGTGLSVGTESSFAEFLALAVLVVSVLRNCAMAPALLLAAAGAVAIVGSGVLRGEAGIAEPFGVLSALGWGGAVAIGLLWRDLENRRRATMDEVRTGERMELARELHDVVAHHVTGIIVAAQAASVVARTSPDDVDRALTAIETAGTDAMTAMRRMVGVLRGQDEEGARTPGAELSGLPVLVERFDRSGELVKLNSDPGLEHAVLPPGLANTGYRLVQEALTNVRRHAPGATAVEIDVHLRDGALLVSVRNDGVGTGSRRVEAGGFGLVGMSERVAALEGRFTAGPTAPGVWTVTAWLPLGRPGRVG